MFDDIHQVVLDEISDNIASLVQSGIYGAIDKYDITPNGFYVIRFISEAYTLQNNAIIYVQVISSVELVVKAKYIRSIQEKTHLYWKQHPLQQTIIVPTRTILHLRIDVVRIIYVQ